MNNFSEIKNITSTRKDHLINEMVNSTGLQKERVEKLYEEFSFANNGDLKKINESFSDFINPEKNNFDYLKFKTNIISFVNRLINSKSNNEKYKINDDLTNFIINEIGICIDSATILELVSYVLLQSNKNFEKIANITGFGKNTDLFENQKISSDFAKINKELIPTKNKKLFESLREILSKNEKHWGITYHLDNAYIAIVEYLDNEIQELTNQENIYSVEDNFHLQLLTELITLKQINQMYRHIDVLRTLIPDMQTFIFDGMLLLHSYIQRNEYSMKFINKNTYLDYIEATKILFAAISTSKNSSKIRLINTDFQETPNSNQPMSGNDQIFGNFQIDSTKLDILNYPISLNACVDIVHIIKSSEVEFNLHLRKVINNYVTKTLNLLASTEKIILEQRKTNKFKNGF